MVQLSSPGGRLQLVPIASAAAKDSRQTLLCGRGEQANRTSAANVMQNHRYAGRSLVRGQRRPWVAARR
jgi:hypothetical protein